MPNIRKSELPHEPPNWIPDGETYYLTLNCERRWVEQLTTASVFAQIKSAAHFYEQQYRWRVYLIVVMPDHLHALVAINTAQKPLTNIVGSWKRYLAKTAQIGWQKNFFEHRIRNDVEFELKAEYMRQNPLRARLVREVRAWPYFIESQSK